MQLSALSNLYVESSRRIRGSKIRNERKNTTYEQSREHFDLSDADVSGKIGKRGRK